MLPSARRAMPPAEDMLFQEVDIAELLEREKATNVLVPCADDAFHVLC